MEPGDDHSIIDGDPDGETDHGEDGVRCGWDGEGGGAELAVGLGSLEDNVGLLLDYGKIVDRGGDPDWEYPDQAFYFFDFLNAAEFPWIGGGTVRVHLVLRCLDCGFV